MNLVEWVCCGECTLQSKVLGVPGGAGGSIDSSETVADVMALLVLAALVLEGVLYGAWAVPLVYVCLCALPFLVGAISGDLEALGLMLKCFPIYLLAVPSFVGSASAYNLARLADITWGNRPAASAGTPACASTSRTTAAGRRV